MCPTFYLFPPNSKVWGSLLEKGKAPGWVDGVRCRLGGMPIGAGVPRCRMGGTRKSWGPAAGMRIGAESPQCRMGGHADRSWGPAVLDRWHAGWVARGVPANNRKKARPLQGL